MNLFDADFPFNSVIITFSNYNVLAVMQPMAPSTCAMKRDSFGTPCGIKMNAKAVCGDAPWVAGVMHK